MNVAALPLFVAGFLLWALPTAGLFLLWNRINEQRGFRLMVLSVVYAIVFFLVLVSNGKVID